MAPQKPTNAVLCVLLAVGQAAVYLVVFDPNMIYSRILLRFSLFNLFVWICYCSFIYPRFVSPLRHLKGPKGEKPFLGFGLAPFKKPIGSFFVKVMKEVPGEDLILYHGLLGIDVLFLAGPRALADVFVHKPYDFVKPERVISFLTTVLGDGLLLAEGDDHKFQRKKIMPSFSFRHIKELYPIFWQKSTGLVQAIEAEIHDNPATWTDTTSAEKGGACGKIEINHFATLATFDIIGLAGLGYDFNTLKAEKHELVDAYEELLETSGEKAAFFVANMVLPQKLVQSLPWKMNTMLKDTSSILRRNCDNLVQMKKDKMKTGSDDHFDILSILLKTNDFSDRNLSDQLLTFLAAGHETTSSALTWTTYNLALHPTKQSVLRTELRAALPARSGPWDPSLPLASTLESLPYLNAVCNEVLRLFPTIPITVRETVRDTTIAGTLVPQGTRAIISPWAVNRSPEFWGPDAEAFVPERWIDQETGKVTNEGGAVTRDGKGANYVNLTFLHGPRSCIGQSFAKAELRALVAALVRGFEFELWDKEKEVEIVGVVTTKPKGGLMLRVRETVD